jgi:predicted metal-dependent hydrolase
MNIMKQHSHFLPETTMLDDITVRIRSSARAKRVSIRITTPGVELILPSGADYAKALAFLSSRKPWIKSKLHSKPANQQQLFHNGAIIQVLGKPLHIEHTGSLRGIASIEQSTLYVSGEIAHLQRRVTDFLRKLLHKEIEKRATHFAAKLGCSFTRISLRDTTSRWGSCSSSGNLSFSWRLVFAPSEVLDYVIIHEICHLKEMNHSDRFWELVAGLCPDYIQHRTWLKKHGTWLHAIG